ncbi:uncharacterized protein N7477_007325 [Penicillium maclennaniae]|uniref:uncharacterized protein n=1 Tax=Penicillium maclennaniae TaxID=1343394 RepID=UPI0025410EEA|nr:uncharacterized protein N7477_007325 [Penicillium maclennaniae]KAJ5664877.1 hypothetical protein N7477_007325 [Penicillium maclennaniae]
MQDFRLTAFLGACLIVLPTFTDAFWRLPCRGRTGVARLDPIVEPGEISGHIHAVHGAGNFGMSSDMNTLLDSSCTSCAVEQDMSAYWTPPLYFMHTNGSAELVPQIGGMLVYYLLYGENVTAFPSNFRLLAGDPYQRNFTWPIPDPPKSSWSGAQLSQEALRQKAIGFNCLNYAMAPEPSLYRHFLPNKTYLDEHCTDGVRLELMFPSCWNGEDVDSTDHKSHMAYPTLVIDGTCPEGYETRLVSLFFETIWDTYVFKDVDGYFTLSNGDPTGFGYHGDFMYGWEDGVLQEAVDTCTSDTGLVEDCAIFNLQSESNQRECFFDVPESLKDENVYMHANGLPGAMAIESGPAYATMSMASSPSSSTTSLEPSTTSKEPSTTSKEPSTTSKEPSTTSQEPGTTSKEPSTTSQEPGTTLKEPGTALQEPGTSTPYISISLPPLSISIGDLNLDALCHARARYYCALKYYIDFHSYTDPNHSGTGVHN